MSRMNKIEAYHSHRYKGWVVKLQEMVRGDTEATAQDEAARILRMYNAVRNWDSPILKKMDWLRNEIFILQEQKHQLEAESKRQCAWTVNAEGAWDTGCDNRFEFATGGPKENRAEYCQFCGGRLIEKGGV